MSAEEGLQYEITYKLEELLKNMRDWEKKPLVKVGKAVIELIKLPRRESGKVIEPEKLALHVRLEDAFKGVFITEFAELQDVIEALKTKTVVDIAKAMDVINRRRVIEYKL